mmetsp:Transcript_33745/g.79569  ORF Transcript_33745/g.79569 Transcript_33745/m.79569 type:complete len:121 (-) Transcript_33745:566-928(-)
MDAHLLNVWNPEGEEKESDERNYKEEPKKNWIHEGLDDEKQYLIVRLGSLSSILIGIGKIKFWHVGYSASFVNRRQPPPLKQSAKYIQYKCIATQPCNCSKYVFNDLEFWKNDAEKFKCC